MTLILEAELVDRLQRLRTAPPDGTFEDRLWARLAEEPEPVRVLSRARRWRPRTVLIVLAAALVPAGALAGVGYWRPWAPPSLEAVVPAKAPPVETPARIERVRPSLAPAAVSLEAPTIATGETGAPASPPVARAVQSVGPSARGALSVAPEEAPTPIPAASTGAAPPLALGRVRMQVDGTARGPVVTATANAPHTASLRGAAAATEPDAPRLRAAGAGDRPPSTDDVEGLRAQERQQERERAREVREGVQRRERLGSDNGGGR
ncbi:MAG: hypothetical protein JW751_19070 [Polyangiaceae bacterium]|nr:hypothetical protein [Polyangiaceae bacterium]